MYDDEDPVERGVYLRKASLAHEPGISHINPHRSPPKTSTMSGQLKVSSKIAI